MAGVNPFDRITISGTREIKPLPHIPGAETSGEIEKIGEYVSDVFTWTNMQLCRGWSRV